jgi:phage replication-related protein YjqB (UPF0714/DUF867 family)
MRPFNLLITLALSLSVSSFVVLPHGASAADGEEGHDKYRDFSALSAHERADRDYRVELTDHQSEYSVFAIHGGRIEKGTTEIAQKIAGSDRNFYSFEGVKGAHNWDLHITSAHFDEPRGLALASHSKRCVSLHGFAGADHSVKACIGGGDVARAQSVAHALQGLGSILQVEYPCSRFPGKDDTNIVNRCSEKGVQIEMTAELREKIEKDSAFGLRFATVIRSATEK